MRKIFAVMICSGNCHSGEMERSYQFQHSAACLAFWSPAWLRVKMIHYLKTILCTLFIGFHLKVVELY